MHFKSLEKVCVAALLLPLLCKLLKEFDQTPASVLTQADSNATSMEHSPKPKPRFTVDRGNILDHLPRLTAARSRRVSERPAPVSETMNGFSVLSDATRGRYVCASKAFKKGDTVFSEECYGLVVCQDYQEVACGYCCKLCVGMPVVAIAADDPIRYCSTTCAQSDYNMHSQEAKGLLLLQRLRVQGVDVRAMADSLKLVVRLGAIRKQGSSGSSSSGRTHPLFGKENSFSDIMLLEANNKHTSAEAKQDIASIAEQLEKVAKILQLPLSKGDIEFLLYAIQCNAHKITDAPTGSSLGVGLFPFTSMLNHSCRPSCQHYFVSGEERPPLLVMRALRDIEPGDELSYSYLPMYQSQRARQEQLGSAYGFSCSCERCSTASSAGDHVIDGVDDGSVPDAMKVAVDSIEVAVCACYSQQLSAEETRLAVQRLLACSAKSGEALSALKSPLHRALFQSYYCCTTVAHRSMLQSQSCNGAAATADADTVICCGLLFLGSFGSFIDTPAPEVARVLLCIADALACGGAAEEGTGAGGAPTDASAGSLLCSFLHSPRGARAMEGLAFDTAPLLQSAQRYIVSCCGSGSSSCGGDKGVVRALCSALCDGGVEMRRATSHRSDEAVSDVIMAFIRQVE